MHFLCIYLREMPADLQAEWNPAPRKLRVVVSSYMRLDLKKKKKKSVVKVLHKAPAPTQHSQAQRVLVVLVLGRWRQEFLTSLTSQSSLIRSQETLISVSTEKSVYKYLLIFFTIAPNLRQPKYLSAGEQTKGDTPVLSNRKKQTPALHC